MKINLKLVFLIISILYIGLANASMDSPTVIDTKDTFDMFNKESELKCYEIVSSKGFSKKEVTFILKNCKSHYISNMLVKLNKNLFVNNIKAFNIDLRVGTNTTNLNIALLNIYKLKRPYIKLTNHDYDLLWNSSGLYSYYAYVLATDNKNTKGIIEFLKKKADFGNFPFGDHFFYLTGPSIIITYSNKVSNYKKISEFFIKELDMVPSKLIPYLYYQTNFNSERLREFEFERLQRITKLMDKDGYNSRSMFKMASKYFNRLVYLSYLSKDGRMIKKIDKKENHVFFHKSSLFLIEKSNQNVYLDPYIFFLQNIHFIHYERVPYHIKDYRIL